MEISDVVAGSALSAVLVREVLPYLLKKMGNGNGNGKDSAGMKSTDFWRLEIREAVEESFTKVVGPKLDLQTDILRDIRDELRHRQHG